MKRLFNIFFIFCFVHLFVNFAKAPPAFSQEDDLMQAAPQDRPQEIKRSLDVEAARDALLNEAPPEILSISVKNVDVQLFLHGYWKGSLSAGWGFQKSPLGIIPTQAFILFDQEPNIDLSLWIYKKWFIEAYFEEGYEDGINLSSYAAGYKGGENDFVQFAVIGNKMLDFPDYPYIDLGADTPLDGASSSLGFYGRFGAGNLKLHSLVRYDVATQEERVFVGGRERSYSYLSPSSRVRGISFVLPDENIANSISVYFEDSSGWRLASAGEYAASSKLGIVELAVTPKGKVAVSYGAGNYDMGLYDDGSGKFLNAAQRYFSEDDLKQYPQPGEKTSDPDKPGTISINGQEALVIWEAGTFSPFERQSLYKAPISSVTSAALVKNENDERIKGYTINERAENSLFSEDPLYSNTLEGSFLLLKRQIYELSHEKKVDKRSPESLWPLAKGTEGNVGSPKVYLNEVFDAPSRIRMTSFSGSSGLNIGTDVVEGSVKVKRGAVEDPNFSYDPSSGRVSLSNPPTFNEIIRISYLKRSITSNGGSLAAAIGTVWDVNEHFSWKSAIAFRWNLFASDAEGNMPYSSNSSASPGTLALTNSFDFRYKNIDAKLNVAGGWKHNDSNDLYRAEGMEGKEIIEAMSDSSFISNAPQDPPLSLFDRQPLIYRNYKKTDALGSSTLMNIEESAAVVENQNQPYPANDARLAGRVMALESELPAATWSGFQSPLTNGELFAIAKEIDIPYRLYGFRSIDNFSVYLQLGSMGEKDSAFNENPSLILSQKLYSSSDTYHENARLGRLTLNDADRARLQNAKYIRYIIVNEGSSPITGRILCAPLIVRGAKFTPLFLPSGGRPTFDDRVSTVETFDASLQSKYPTIIKRLHQGGLTQRVLKIEYDDASNPLSTGDAVGAGGRIGSLPFTNYKKLSFFIKGEFEEDSNLEIVIAQTAESYNDTSRVALRAIILGKTLTDQGSASWTKVELKYTDLDTYNPDALKTYNEDTGASENDSAYIMFFVHPPAGTKLDRGDFYIDEIILEESTDELWLNAGGNFRYQNNDVLLTAGKLDVISEPLFETSVETATSGSARDSETESVYFNALHHAGAGITILGTRVTGNFTYSLDNNENNNNSFWWNGGHGIVMPLGPVTISENFFTAPFDKRYQHFAGVKLNGNVNSFFSTESSFFDLRETRNFSAGFGVNKMGRAPISFSLGANASWAENSSAGDAQDENKQNYGQTYITSWQSMIPDDGRNAIQRNTSHFFRTAFSKEPVGLNFSLNGNTAFSEISQSTESGSTSVFSIPWSFKNIKGSFTQERTLRRRILFAGNNVQDDLSFWASSLEAGSSLLCEIPFYSLFDEDLPRNLSDFASSSNQVSQYAIFSDRYALGFQFPNSYGLRTLYVPKSFDFQTARNTSQNYDTVLDLLNIGAQVNFSVVNMFGAFGAAPLFKFYQNDQYNSSVSFNAVIPKGSNFSYRIGISNDIEFYGFKGAIFGISDEINIMLDSYTIALNLSFTSPAKKSILGMIYTFFVNKFSANDNFPLFKTLAAAGSDLSRVETLELFFDKSSDNFKWTLSAEHKTVLAVVGIINLNAFIAVALYKDTEAKLFSLNASMGTSISIMF